MGPYLDRWVFIWTHCPLSGLMGHYLEDEPIDGPLHGQDGPLCGHGEPLSGHTVP